FNSAALKDHLSHTLPDYMIPVFFIELEELPLTPGGKIDTRALPEPGFVKGDAFRPPEEEIEKRLAALWSEILSVPGDRIGMDSNFFQLGGHSLNAVVMISGIQKEMGVTVPLSIMFKAPTIRGLAEYIKGAAAEIHTPVEPAEKREYYVLSPAQKRLYVLQQMDLESTSYNIPQVFALGDMEIHSDRLESIFHQLIRRHESFHTSFQTIAEVPVQRIHESGIRDQGIGIRVRAGFPRPGEFIRPFDLTRAPLLRVELVQSEDGNSLLMVDMHHIISDGVSMEILIREFLSLYKGEELPELPLQYTDYTHWLNSGDVRQKIWLQSSYWRKVFTGDVPVLNLPTDFPRPAIQVFEGDNINFETGAVETAALTNLAMEQGTTMYMVLLALFNVFLAKLSGQDDIVVGTPVAARMHADLQGIIGMFVNTLVLRNFPGPETALDSFLADVKSRTLQAFENQESPFEELVEQIEITRDAARNPLFDVMFAFNPDSVKRGEGMAVSRPDGEGDSFGFDSRVSKFDLTLTVTAVGERIAFNFEYCTRLFKADTARRFADYFSRIVAAAAANPAITIDAIRLISEEEKQQILHEFNDTAVDFPREAMVPELFQQQVERTPDRTALKFGNSQLTYTQLNRQADALAVQLRDRGVAAGSIAAVMVERSLEMIIAALGILKSGAAYLPIDP
ncbi:MAG: AMP-binding protein, partial [bacterium]|nr:AMP-binding protein [bacterium]